jgi:general secretion pathway protein F
MPLYDVRVSEGRAVATQRVEAADAQSVAARLGVPAVRILSVVMVAPHALAGAPPGPQGAAFPLRLFSQELAVLLGAGIPLLEALVTLREKEGSVRVAAALDAVVQRLQQGEAFSAALSTRTDAFDPLFRAVVASAERTGQLRQALAAHAAYLAWADQLRARLLGASLYPLMLLTAGTAVLLFLLVFVVPRFAGLLEDVGGDMPAASRWLIGLGSVTGAHPAATLAIAAVLLGLPLLAWRHRPLREAAADALWAVPALGDKLRLLALARLYRTVGMLLDAGVPVVPALASAAAVTAPRLRTALEAVRDAVARGERFSAALEREGLGTPVSVRMVRVGERSGSVGPMLGQAAAFYDEELSRLSDLVTRLVNPLLMLVMGVVIGGVIVLMYLPIFQVMEQVQ